MSSHNTKAAIVARQSRMATARIVPVTPEGFLLPSYTGKTILIYVHKDHVFVYLHKGLYNIIIIMHTDKHIYRRQSEHG